MTLKEPFDRCHFSGAIKSSSCLKYTNIMASFLQPQQRVTETALGCTVNLCSAALFFPPYSTILFLLAPYIPISRHISALTLAVCFRSASPSAKVLSCFKKERRCWTEGCFSTQRRLCLKYAKVTFSLKNLSNFAVLWWSQKKNPSYKKYIYLIQWEWLQNFFFALTEIV